MNDLLEQMQQIKQDGISQPGDQHAPRRRQDHRRGDRGRRSPAQEDRSHHQFYDQAGTGKARQSSIRTRKRRIAAGSGTKVEDVNRLLKQFEQMQKMMKMMGSSKVSVGPPSADGCS